jgi:urea transport system ATP-binding protein
MKIAVEDLHSGYGRASVLFGVSLEAPEGEVTCVMGRNGVGKTTLLNTIMGLLPLHSGRVLINGEDVSGLPAHRRALLGVAYVPQGHQSFPHLTVKENLQVVQERGRGALFRRRTGGDGGSDNLLDRALDLFPALIDLTDRPAGLLSGGQAQQLAIARALVTGPRTLILDEPTEGIQPSIIEEIEAAIERLHRETGMTILLVEQYVDMALRIARNYAVMERGQITRQGETAAADPATFTQLMAV